MVTRDPRRNSTKRVVAAPVDKGFGAWSFVRVSSFVSATLINIKQLVAAFFIEGLVWGFPNAFGVFLDGIIYCSASITRPHNLPRHCEGSYHRRTFMWAGAILCWASLLGASYTTKVSTLIGLQGVLYAVGGLFLYAPYTSYMSEWFVARRGIANDVIFAALLLHALPFVKPRIPDSRSHQQIAPPRSREWIKSASFSVLLAANTFQGFGYFVPIVWLPTFAHAMNLSTTNSSLTVALLNGASVLGRLSMGYLSDKFNPWFLGMPTLFATSLATFVLWGVLSQNLAGLLAFGIAYGVLAGGWSSLWTGFVSPIAKDDPNLATYLFGYLMLSRGVGNILCTPISSVLETASGSAVGSASTGFQVADGRFENMILYVGPCFTGAAGMALSGWGLDMNIIRSRRQRV
ncbi:MFS general substrate transporter [Desarmillaria ectypa]|nr:MFS general substrate transporter [Desarmillaria ectypa]